MGLHSSRKKYGASNDEKCKKDEDDEGDEEMHESESEEKTEDPDVAAAEAGVTESSADATEEPNNLQQSFPCL